MGKYTLENYIGKTYNKLTVIGVTEKVSVGNKFFRLLVCRCECGGNTQTTGFELTSGRAVSCGCNKYKLTKSLIGKKFGKLTVVEQLKNNKPYRRTVYRLKCDCGKTTNVSYSNLVKKNCQKSCGKCGLFRNGVMTSWVALDINKMIPEAKHNYYTGVVFKGRNLNVDMALIDDKIAIEYDGQRWHKDRQQQDREKTLALIHDGWKVLRIKSRRKLPDKQELLNLINELKNTEQDLIVLHLKDE